MAGPRSLERCLISVLFLLLAYFPSRRDIFQADLDLILRGLLKEEGFRTVNGENRVAIGFGSCVDVFADALHLLEDLGIDPPSEGRHYDIISSSTQLAESFAYFFNYGAAAERFVSGEELFQKWVSAARMLNLSQESIGGNAPVMANRFAMEGWQVLLGAKMKQETIRQLHNSVRLANGSSEINRDDVHLILEYDLGSSWGRYTSPRANRFIVHNDHSNMLLESLDPFIEAVESYHPSLVVVGGLQMLDNFPFDLELRTTKLKQLQTLLSSLPPSTKVHFEMASFSEERFMKDLLTYVLPYTDSIGMNEQELANLCSLLEYGNITIISDSNPRVATSLDQLRVLYRGLRKGKQPGERALTRIHLHTLAYQAILVSKHSDWRNTHGAIAKASLTANRHVCASTWIDTSHARLILDESFSVSTKPGSHRMPLIESSPISCWNEGSAKICVAPVLVCTTIHQTAGGGDNISAAGLVLQL